LPSCHPPGYSSPGKGYYSGAGMIGSVRSSSISTRSTDISAVHILYFRGNGYAGEKYDPSVDSSIIHNSLFIGEIYSPRSGFGGTFEKLENLTSSSSNHLKIPVRIIHSSSPVTIGNNAMVFFWGVESLPANKSTPECVRYRTS
ncbi:hypothetical protein PENTCL1PPCAC_27336, partial [Pristionchus entomophagus]